MNKGTVVMMWQGQNGTYWEKVRYWIGAGYQYADRETTADRYELWNI